VTYKYINELNEGFEFELGRALKTEDWKTQDWNLEDRRVYDMSRIKYKLNTKS